MGKIFQATEKARQKNHVESHIVGKITEITDKNKKNTLSNKDISPDHGIMLKEQQSSDSSTPAVLHTHVEPHTIQKPAEVHVKPHAIQKPAEVHIEPRTIQKPAEAHVESHTIQKLAEVHVEPHTIENDPEVTDKNKQGTLSNKAILTADGTVVEEEHTSASSTVNGNEIKHETLQVLDKNLITHFKPHSMEAEQFRMLKTSIFFPDKGKPPRTIMITSSLSGEGKSFVAANLAVSMASSIDEYVLLMDCDLRKPTVHKQFGFPDNTPGLTEYLTQNMPISTILKKAAIDKLTILPCGTPPSNPSELISSEQMRNLIHEVKSRYEDRYIIIDSPPPYVTAEANALAKQVDAIIIVVKTGKTQKKAIQALLDIYGRKKILGVVQNFSNKRQTQYSYAYANANAE